jgi:hypothetical protein
MVELSQEAEALLLEVLDLYSPTDPGLIINRERGRIAQALESAGFLRIDRSETDASGRLQVFMTPAGAGVAQAIARNKRSQTPLVG